MFVDEFAAAAEAAKTKSEFLSKNPSGFFVASMMSGVHVGLGVLLAFTAGSLLLGQPYDKIVMGMSFSIAFNLIIMAGSELFTGSTFVASTGFFSKTVKPGEILKLWAVCYIGNWLGAVLLSVLFYGSGLASGPVGEFIASAAAAKMSIPFVPLLFRGILCNILVSLAVWCMFKCRTEGAKLAMAFWCIFAFVTTGFEHCVANMVLFTLALLTPSGQAVSIGGYLYNISVVTLGNLVGGALCVALPYYMISKNTKRHETVITLDGGDVFSKNNTIR